MMYLMMLLNLLETYSRTLINLKKISVFCILNVLFAPTTNKYTQCTNQGEATSLCSFVDSTQSSELCRVYAAKCSFIVLFYFIVESLVVWTGLRPGTNSKFNFGENLTISNINNKIFLQNQLRMEKTKAGVGGSQHYPEHIGY